jgi:putative membrane protein
MKPAITLLAATLALGLAACANDNDADNTAGTGMADSSAQAGATSGDAADAGTMGSAADAMAPDPNNPAGMAGVAGGDHKALAAVMEVDRHEIAAAGDALSKNVEGEVRSYAEMLRDDHTRNLEATRRLMGDAGTSGDMGAHHAQNTAAATAGTAGAAGGTGTGTAGTAAGTAAGAGTGADAAAGQAPSDPELAAMRQKHDAERERLAALEGEEFTRAWVDAMVRGHEEALAKLDNELIPGATDDGVRQHLQDTRTAISRHLDTGRSLQSSTGGGN